ncbi:MAG TPA: tetratricopeptide repeat protein [Candidatus Wallbacteria bacterium]|nr:tetratricopeptide repeat protein [Candidatus Wallbacteria bacterium]
MKKRLLVLTVLFALLFSVSTSFADEFKAPKNLKEAYNMMQASYKDCMKAIADFQTGTATGVESDQKLKAYIYYKAQYEKLLKNKPEATQTQPQTTAATPETQAATASSSNYEKLAASIKKYDAKIAEAPKNPGMSFFRKLFGTKTIADFMFDGYKALQAGNFAKAEENFQTALNKDSSNKQALFYLAEAKAKNGKTAEAEKILQKLNSQYKDDAWAKAFKNVTDPWVEAEVAFKIGGFDSLDDYKKKVAAGNRKELHGDEYYEKYVNPNTFNYYSKSAQKEFESIAGIDCGGFVQRVYMDLCKQNGIKAPFNSKVPGRELESYATQITDDGIIPPMTTKPGDFIILKEHDGWGHAFYFTGRDKDGRPLIVEASGEGKILARPMPDRYYAYYGGTYKFKDMDKIREKMSAAQ